MSWWKRALGMTPTVAVEPQPLELNPSPDVRAERNRQRISRLKQAIAAGDTRPELRRELERRERFGR